MAPPARLPSLSIVLPCHDEAANVEGTVRDAVRVGRRVARCLEVIVVDDGSRDDTAAVAAGLGEELHEVRVVRNALNRGYGGALRRGFAEARMAWIFYTDGDGQLDLEPLPQLIAQLDSSDVATGFRSPRRDPLIRVWNGRAWTALTNVLLGTSVRDVNCAFKVFPRALLDEMELVSDGAAISAELLAKAARLGYRTGEVPVRHRPRVSGRQSGNDPRVIARAFLELAHLLARESTVAAFKNSRTLPF
jgi:glycosyltransferase involved in cell wall biosynthesis